MSIQSEIDRLKQVVSDAFTAIGNKGGTVPTSQVSGNLASAIASIPAGVTVQRKTGSFTTNTSGTATVNCGFKPDLVVIHKSETESNYTISASAAFEERGTKEGLGLWTSSGNGYIYDLYVSQTSSGFSVDAAYTYDANWDDSKASRVTFQYIAVKYT